MSILSSLLGEAEAIHVLYAKTLQWNPQRKFLIIDCHNSANVESRNNDNGYLAYASCLVRFLQ